jgi:DNA mismatch repair ATPase MutS
MIITGSNNNGKTITMDTVGLDQILFQAGIPIVGTEAYMKIKDKILTHNVTNGSIVDGDSTLSAGINKFNELIDYLNGNFLFLGDEMFTGAMGGDGDQLYNKYAGRLIKSQSKDGKKGNVILTTHYHGCASQIMENENNVIGMSVQLNESNNPPYTYKLNKGVNEKSDGVFVAGLFGANKENFDAIIDSKRKAGHTRY